MFAWSFKLPVSLEVRAGTACQSSFLSAEPDPGEVSLPLGVGDQRTGEALELALELDIAKSVAVGETVQCPLESLVEEHIPDRIKDNRGEEHTPGLFERPAGVDTELAF